MLPPPRSSPDLGATHLENLYCLMKKLSSALYLYEDYTGDGFSVDLSVCGPVIYGLIFHLSNWAFEELQTQFEQIISLGKVVPPEQAARAQFHLHQDVSSSSQQEFKVLLRCCIIMLHLLEFELNLVMEKSRILLKIFQKLCSLHTTLLFLPQKPGDDRWITSIQSLVSYGGIYKDLSGSECSFKDTSPSVPFVCSILEVFADELLLHQNMRKHLSVTCCISSASDQLLAPHCVTCDIGIILELVSAHFLLSSYAEIAFGTLFHSNTCYMMDAKSSNLSLTAALSLLLETPAVFSAPYMFQSHVILLVSRCVTAYSDPKETAMNCYMSAFEQSVILYACHSSSLPLSRDSVGAKCQSRSFVREHCVWDEDLCLPFRLHVRTDTYDAIDVHIQKLVDCCSWKSCIFLSRTKAEMVTDCMAYIKENLHIIQEPWREDACSILKCISSRTAEEADIALLHKNEVNLQETYLVAALLRLMGSSLLQIVEVLSKHGTKTLNDYILCRHHELVSSIIDFFGEHMVGQYVLCDMQVVYSSKHQQTKLMLAHLTSLLFYTIDRRLYPLWESCIFVMMAVMNLLAFEEGNLDTVWTMFGSVREITICQVLASKISPVLFPRRSSLTIASNFQKIQILHSVKNIKCLTNDTGRADVGTSQTPEANGPSRTSNMSPRDEDSELSTEVPDKCNGDAFLRCFLEDHKLPDWDDLANFIEVRHGKDYASWLQKKERYNMWKHRKMAVAKHQKKCISRQKITKFSKRQKKGLSRRQKTKLHR